MGARIRKLRKEIKEYADKVTQLREELNKIENVTHRVGNIYKGPDSDDTYMLSLIAPNEVVLIGLQSGNRWNDSVKVANRRNITQAEFDMVCLVPVPDSGMNDWEYVASAREAN